MLPGGQGAGQSLCLAHRRRLECRHVFELTHHVIQDPLPFFLHNVIGIRDRRLTTFIADFLGAMLTARRRGIDTVIDMEFFSRASAIFAFLSGASTRVGLHRFTGWWA